jgi:hypothetical protein
MMSVRLFHPGLGAEFDAAESAVEHWARSGWVRAAEWRAQQNGTQQNGNGASTPAASISPKAGKAEETKE